MVIEKITSDLNTLETVRKFIAQESDKLNETIEQQELLAKAKGRGQKELQIALAISKGRKTSFHAVEQFVESIGTESVETFNLIRTRDEVSETLRCGCKVVIWLGGSTDRLNSEIEYCKEHHENRLEDYKQEIKELEGVIRELNSEVAEKEGDIEDLQADLKEAEEHLDPELQALAEHLFMTQDDFRYNRLYAALQSYV